MSGGWNRGVLLYIKVSSVQGVGIEEFHCIIQRCRHFRILSFTLYRGFLCCFSRNVNREVPLLLMGSSFYSINGFCKVLSSNLSSFIDILSIPHSNLLLFQLC